MGSEDVDSPGESDVNPPTEAPTPPTPAPAAPESSQPAKTPQRANTEASGSTQGDGSDPGQHNSQTGDPADQAIQGLAAALQSNWITFLATPSRLDVIRAAAEAIAQSRQSLEQQQQMRDRKQQLQGELERLKAEIQQASDQPALSPDSLQLIARFVAHKFVPGQIEHICRVALREYGSETAFEAAAILARENPRLEFFHQVLKQKLDVERQLIELGEEVEPLGWEDFATTASPEYLMSDPNSATLPAFP